MKTEWERVNQIFHEAMEFTGEERAAFVARASENDPELEREVLSLIAMHEENNSFMEVPAFGANLTRQFGKWQTQIIDSLTSPVRKHFAGTDRMIGRVLDGKYEIEALCGRGGMGAVYRATHLGTGRRVAVKVIAPELAGNSEFIDRFKREAKTIGLLRHPNVVNVTDFGISGEGKETDAYLVMEYLEGHTLADRMRDRRPMPINEAIAILSQVCAAIDEAHRLGILHRDLKPENIWLEPAAANGIHVKVLDFGIARMQELLAFDALESPPESIEPVIPKPLFSITEEETLRLNYTAQQLSRFGSLMGTPKYMSPEQCRGERLDKASDIYSLGVIAYQMLDGDPPFIGTVPEVLLQHREVDPIPLNEKRRGIPKAVDSIVRQALAKDKSARPTTAGGFAFQLKLHSESNEWIRREADDFCRRHRWKLIGMTIWLQLTGWLLSLLMLLGTLALPGMPPVMSVAIFGLLWLSIAAITIRGQNILTAACTLFLDQSTGATKIDLRAIIRAVKEQSSNLAQASLTEIISTIRSFSPLKFFKNQKVFDSTLMIPALIQEKLSVDEASNRSAILTKQIRQKRYPLFRRFLAFTLNVAAWQVILLYAGFILDGVIEKSWGILSEAFWITTPLTLLVCILVLYFSMKSSIEQSLIYQAARRALGEIPPDLSDARFRSGPEKNAIFRMQFWRTYVPTGALIILGIGLQLSVRGDTPHLIRNNHVFSSKALNACGVPIPLWSSDSWYPVTTNVLQSPRMTKYLLEKGALVNTDIKIEDWWTPQGIGHLVSTPLMAALSIGSVDSARLLLERGADVHARDAIGRTPMTVAITYCPTAIKMLLSYGVDINEQTRFGSPLLTAARYQLLYPQMSVRSSRGVNLLMRNEKKYNAVRILLENGADPNTRDSEMRNALMVMSLENRHGQVVELIGETLIKAGCDINAVDSNGRTPLIYAVRAENAWAVRLLLKHGADIDISDHNGFTALDYTKNSENEEIKRILAHPLIFIPLPVPIPFPEIKIPRPVIEISPGPPR